MSVDHIVFYFCKSPNIFTGGNYYEKRWFEKDSFITGNDTAD